MERYQLPPELRCLPSVTAEPFIQLNPTLPRPNLEGADFDADGKLLICRRLRPASEVLKIDVDTGAFAPMYREEDSELIGAAVHRDGRIFLVDIKGRLPVISPEGQFLFDMMEAPGLERFIPNDLVFDKDYNVYVTDFHAGMGFAKPEGGIYRFDAEGGYRRWTKLLDRLTTPNGVGLSPSGDALWFCESATNDLYKVSLGPDGLPMQRFTAYKKVVHTGGFDLMDSLKVDALGNVYVAMMGGGRVLVVDQDGIAVQNVLQADRTAGRCLSSPNLALHPTRNEGYILASGEGGSWLYKFEALSHGLRR